MSDAGEASTAVNTAARYGGESVRGGGGKLRRERKPPATPYDRPPRGRWISKIVDPAKRLFSGLPSLFYPSPSSDLDDEEEIEEEQEGEGGREKISVDLAAPVSTGGVVSSKDKGKSKLDISDEHRLDKRGNCSDGVPDIEQLIKGKTFSREDIDHLMKILHSKVVDVEQDRKTTPRMTGLAEAEKAETSFEMQKTSVYEEEDLNQFRLATSTPLVRPTTPYGIDASPVDIARAYMGSRTSDLGFTSTNVVPKTEKLGYTGEFPSKPVMPSPGSKTPICWPGAVTQNQPDYYTPQSRNHRSGLHSFPRTPYSRSIFSKTKSKLTPLRGASEGFPSISPSSIQPTATPVYGKSINNVADSSYGSGGPLRRVRNKYTSATPVRKSTMSITAERSPWTREPNLEFEPKKNFEPGSSSNTKFKSVSSSAESPESGVSNVHPHSSRLARQILEQLDRPITLDEKSKELKLAGSWKDSSVVPFENVSSPSTVGTDFGKSNKVGVKFYDQTNGESNVLPQERINSMSAAGKDIFGAATSQDRTSSIFGVNTGPPLDAEKLNPNRSTEQGAENNLPKTSFLFGNASKGAAITNNPAKSQPHNSQRKPNLPSIAIEKSGTRTSFAPVTGATFTFPFNTPSTTTTEPPTPSFLPSFLTSSPPQSSKVSATFPSVTTSNKITIAPPVIASSSATTSMTPNDVSTPKFNFGSGKPRISFAVAGDDAEPTPNDAATPKYKFGSGKTRLNFDTIGSSDAVCC